MQITRRRLIPLSVAVGTIASPLSPSAAAPPVSQQDGDRAALSLESRVDAVSAAQSVGTRTGLVYFVHGGPGVNGWRGRLETVSRSGAESPRNAVLALLRGINPSEQARGLRTAIPQKTRLVNFSVARDTASIWLRTQGAGSGPPAEPTWKRLGGDDFYGTAQLVYTLTVFRTIKHVALFVNGRHCCIWTHQNTPVTAALTRFTFAGWQGTP